MSYDRSYGGDEWYDNRYNGQQYSLSPPPPHNGYPNNYHHHDSNYYNPNNHHNNNGYRGRKHRKREKGKGGRPKTPQPRGRKPVNRKYKEKQIRSHSQPPPKKPKKVHTKYQQEPHKIIEYLQTLHNEMEQKKSINIRNLGWYLRKAVNGYQNAIHSSQIADDEKFIANIAQEMLDEDEKGNDDTKEQEEKPNMEHKEAESKPVESVIYVKMDINDGLVQFGNNIRKFLECYCQYLWKGNMNKSGGPKKYLTLSYKIDQLIRHRNEMFPDDVMDCVDTLNRLVHSVDKNKDAAEMYLDKKEQCVLLRQLCEMAEFVEDKLVDREVLDRIN